MYLILVNLGIATAAHTDRVVKHAGDAIINILTREPLHRGMAWLGGPPRPGFHIIFFSQLRPGFLELAFCCSEVSFAFLRSA
jgi:hypothetical protein